MSGQANRYTLNIIVDENNIIPLAKGPLETLDEVTSNFKTKQEFLDAIIKELNIKIEGKVIRINITYNQNKKTRNMRVLYADNKEALNKAKVGERLLFYSTNKSFVIDFVKRYCNSPYMSALASDVIEAIKSDEDYLMTLQRLIDLTFSSYKSIRDIHFFIKDYENLGRETKKTNIIPQLNNSKDLMNALKTLKSIYQCQQMDLFSLLNEQMVTGSDSTQKGTPRIKKENLKSIRATA